MQAVAFVNLLHYLYYIDNAINIIVKKNICITFFLPLAIQSLLLLCCMWRADSSICLTMSKKKRGGGREGTKEDGRERGKDFELVLILLEKYLMFIYTLKALRLVFWIQRFVHNDFLNPACRDIILWGWFSSLGCGLALLKYIKSKWIFRVESWDWNLLCRLHWDWSILETYPPCVGASLEFKRKMNSPHTEGMHVLYWFFTYSIFGTFFKQVGKGENLLYLEI